jgi:zinc transporter
MDGAASGEQGTVEAYALEPPPADGDGLECAYLLDGHGGGRPITLAELHDWTPGQGTLWLHFDRKAPGTRRWLEEESGLSRVLVEALLAEETRPRFTLREEGLLSPDSFLLVLRGINLNPGAEPEDMVSLRIWANHERVISLRHRQVAAIGDIRASVEAGNYPRGPADLVVTIAQALSDHVEPVVEDLDDEVDRLEQRIAGGEDGSRAELAEVRRALVILRRYLAPQREVLRQLRRDVPPWFNSTNRARLSEIAEMTDRLVEDLDEARDRAMLVQEELSMRLSEQLNRRTYIFVLIAAIFLPLTLLTGLLGSNVNGIPGAGSDAAFAVVCLIVLVMAAVEIWLLRQLRLF